MVSKIGLKTITVDKIVFDEIEEIEDWSLVALAEERMSHVEEEKKFVHRLSVPSIPSYGIDGYFAGNDDAGIRPSDQRYLHYRCEHCNEWTCFEDEWPECVVEVDAKRQKAIRICKKCKRELPLSSKLQWVPKNLESNILGYHFSQLFSRYINPWKLLDQFQKKRDLTTLYNDKLGIPYVEAEARLELQDIYALCTSNMQLAPSRVRCDGSGSAESRRRQVPCHHWI
jgi:phage terminase large subunit GpA-like protein